MPARRGFLAYGGRHVLAGTRAVRMGSWKVVQEGKRPWALYDLSTDRSETKDLSQAQPERTEALVALWQAWHTRVKR